MGILYERAAAFNNMGQPRLALLDAQEMVKRNGWDARVSMPRLSYGNMH